MVGYPLQRNQTPYATNFIYIKIYKVLPSHCQSTLILDFRTVAFLLFLVLKEHFNLFS